MKVRALLLGSLLALSLTGCYEEEVCMDGEYPVLVQDGPGSLCVPEGSPPPAGYEEFPPGATPTLQSEWPEGE